MARDIASCPTASKPAPSCAPPRPPAATSRCAARAPAILDAVLDKLREAGAAIERRRRLDPPVRHGEAPESGEPPHGAVSRLSRPTCRRSSWRSTAIAEGTAQRHRDDFREPLHARAGAARLGATSTSTAIPRWSRASSSLSGAKVMATDLRASASLVIAALVARGRDADRPHLPPGPRLRAHGSEADAVGALGAPHQRAAERAMIVPQTRRSAEMITHRACRKAASSRRRCRCWRAAGIASAEDPETSRKLILADHDAGRARRHRARHRRADLRAVRRRRPRRRRQGRAARARRRGPVPAARPGHRAAAG